MKNRHFIIAVAAVMIISFGLAPSAHAIVAPLLVALPIAGVIGAIFGSFHKHVKDEEKVAAQKAEKQHAAAEVKSLQAASQVSP